MSYNLYEFLSAIFGISLRQSSNVLDITGKFWFSLCLKASSVPALLISGFSLYQSRIDEGRKEL